MKILMRAYMPNFVKNLLIQTRFTAYK